MCHIKSCAKVLQTRETAKKYKDFFVVPSAACLIKRYSKQGK